MKRLLVVLPNWLGETLFATPFLRALRERLPKVFIATLGRPACKQVLLHSPLIDECLDYDELGAHLSMAGKCRLIGVLRAHKLDVAFILRRSLSRSLLLALAGIKTRIGFANRKSGWLLTHSVKAALSEQKHKAYTYMHLLEAIGSTAEPLALSYEYTVSEEEKHGASLRLRSHGFLDGRPLAILHPGANWSHKRWAPQRFAMLGDRLAERNIDVIISGGPGDIALVESVKRGMKQPSLSLAGATSLREIAACIECAQLVISNDTGILHIAAALRIPIVALYGPTSPYITGPLGDAGRSVVIHHADCCPKVPCFNPDFPPHAGMDAISVDEVFAAAARLI